MIGIIDYKAGNAPSVLNALHRLGVPSSLVSSPDGLRAAAGIILPGVGSAKATMDFLKDMDFIDGLEERVLKQGIPFLGICVGFQVLFEHSDEGDVDCLGWMPGEVKKYPEDMVRVPQMGWNEVKFVRRHAILSSLNDSEFFYFVNSYYVIPRDENIVLAKTRYGIEFCSMAAYKNMCAAQFHVEKSGAVGLKVLRNFAWMAGGKHC